MGRAIVALAALGIGMSGCTYYVGAAALIVPNADNAPTYESLGRVRGRHCTWFEPMPDMSTAIARALASVPEANALANVAIAAAYQNYFLVSRVCVRVDADAVVFEER